MKFQYKPMPLGIDPGTMVKGALAVKSLLSPGGGRSASGYGAGPSFQQQFTPQFSPVMQQQQESPGGRQSATPTQYASGGQSVSPGIPGQPSITPLPSPLPLIEQPVVQTSDIQQQYLKWGIIGILGVLGIRAYQRKK